MKVSVEMLTYNHEKFIAQALDSVLMQQVDFDYEIIIGEDCSTDNTRDIVIDYQKKHPDKIRLLLHDKNVGALNNDIQILKACQGEYIASLEGDDYWTSPHKLQKQVDHLDNHPDCPACFHPVLKFQENNCRGPIVDPPIGYRRGLFLKDFIGKTIINTCSFMFRKSILSKSFLDLYSKSVIGDWEFYFYTAQRSSIECIDEVMAAYRVHGGGIYSGATPFKRLNDRIEVLKNLNSYLKFRYNKTYEGLISQCYYALSKEYANCSNLKKARKYFMMCFSKCFFNLRVSYKNLLIMFVRIYIPQLYNLTRRILG